MQGMVFISAFCWITLLSLPLHAALHEEWKVQSIRNPLVSESAWIDLDLSSTNLCIFDPVTITWKAADKINLQYSNVSSLVLTILSHGEDVGISNSLGYIHEKVDTEGKLSCQLEDLFCQITTEEISLQTDSSKLLIKFNHFTNQPVLASKEDIEEVLIITPPLQSSASGYWKDARTLELELSTEDTERIVESVKTGQVTQVLVRENEASLRLAMNGTRTFRASEHGNFNAFVLNVQSNEIVSKVFDFSVSLCPEKSLLPNVNIRFPKEPPAKLAFSMSGVFPITGTRAITVTNRVVPSIDHGTWSLAVWLKLLQEPTGSFRSIMFKSSVETGYAQRTPSVWLLPESNHLSVHVSTPSNPDTEIISRSVLPINEWTHVCFVFQNNSEILSQRKKFFPNTDATDITTSPPNSIHPDSIYDNIKEKGNYTIKVFINGELDIIGQSMVDILGNNASLQLFKDVTFQGPKAFIQGLSIWEGILSDVDVKRLYSEGVEHHEPIDLVLQLLEEAESTLLPYSHHFRKKKKESSLSTEEDIVVETDVTAKTTSIEKNSGILALLTKQSQESIAECQSYIQRLDIHSESAEMGSMSSLLYWSKLLSLGFEIPDSKCGFASTHTDIQLQKQHHSQASSSRKGLLSTPGGISNNNENGPEQPLLSIQSVDPNHRDAARALYAFLLTLEEGNTEGLLPLAFALLHGIGLESLLSYEHLLDGDWDIPIILEQDFYDYQRRHNRLRKVFGSQIVSTLHHNCSHSLSDEWIGYSSLCQPLTRPSSPLEEHKLIAQVDKVNQMALGLIYLAALYDHVDAFVALAYRYEYGIGGVIPDMEMAAQYSLYPADVASNAYHTIGAQPIIEADRIDDYTEPDLGKGNQGNDDEIIQYQKIRAAEGDIPAMIAMGDLYYYGARGLPRDQGAALRYFQQAADLGNPQGMCGAAGMYLKGEGTPTNVSKAIELYEKAAENASIRAYNGLGYLYFFGSQVPKNETKAFEYFSLAAAYETDGDSLFNAGYCLENGIGTEKNLAKAIYYYTTAAKKTGHFDSVKTLAIFHMEGKGVSRSTKEALVYLNAAKGIGPWMGWMRRGLDLYLAAKTPTSLFSALSTSSTLNFHPLMKSLFCYLYVGELGYEVAQSNAAYILRTKLIPSYPSSEGATQAVASSPSDGIKITEYLTSEVMVNRLLYRQYLLSGKLHLQMENIYHLGNCYFQTRCGLQFLSNKILSPNFRKKAMYYYQIASYGKNPVASAYLGLIYHFNLHTSEDTGESRSIDMSTYTNNLLRAKRYYEDVLALSKDPHWISKYPQYQQLVYFVKVMYQILGLRSYSAFYPVHQVAEQVVKWLWM